MDNKLEWLDFLKFLELAEVWTGREIIVFESVT